MSETTVSVITEQPTAPVEEKRSPGLRSLAAKRQQLKDNLFLDLKVPRWDDPEIFVRYKPVDVTQTEKAIDKRRKSNVDEWQMLANADILAISCEGIYFCENQDYEHKYALRADDQEGTWPKFDEKAAEVLGVAIPGAANVVKALYLTDGDLAAAAEDVTSWSAQKSEKATEDF